MANSKRYWFEFVRVQLVLLVLAALGVFILLIPALRSSWTMRASKQYPYNILAWKTPWIDKVYGNEEDGVDGVRAGEGWYDYQLGQFHLHQERWIDHTHNWSRWRRVYVWSALRNSVNNLRFVFQKIGGPYYRKDFKTWYFHAGWNDHGFPVIGIYAQEAK